jgi:hypothetical protein
VFNKISLNIIALKNRAAKILSSLLLLLTFVAGQVIVIVHTHKRTNEHTRNFTEKNKSGVTEDNCPVCIQHGHIQLFLYQSNFQFWSAESSYTPAFYKAIHHSIKLLLSSNRGPPAL